MGVRQAVSDGAAWVYVDGVKKRANIANEYANYRHRVPHQLEYEELREEALEEFDTRWRILWASG